MGKSLIYKLKNLFNRQPADSSFTIEVQAAPQKKSVSFKDKPEISNASPGFSPVLTHQEDQDATISKSPPDSPVDFRQGGGMYAIPEDAIPGMVPRHPAVLRVQNAHASHKNLTSRTLSPSKPRLERRDAINLPQTR